MGALAGLATAVSEKDIKAIALDSVPHDSNSLLKGTVDRRFPFASSATEKLARMGTYLYFFDGCYKREAACDIAKGIEGRNVLLLAGLDAQEFQESTAKLARCFPPNNKIENKLDLSPSGFSIVNASIEQSEAYDQRLIDFFHQALGN